MRENEILLQYFQDQLLLLEFEHIDSQHFQKD